MWTLVIIGGLFILAGLALKFLLVSVPEVTGLILLNQFNGKLRPVGSGLKRKWPWETYQEKNFFSLELVTKGFSETYAAEDGPIMEVRASYQYNPDQKKLDRYITVDETTIEKGFTDVFSGILSEIIGKKKAEDARKDIQTMEKEVIEKLDASTLTTAVVSSFKEKLENQYGVNWRIFSIADIDFSKDYQEARSGMARMEKIGQTIAVLKTAAPLLDDKEAVNAILVEQGKAKKNIFEVEGLTGAISDAMVKIFGRT